MSRIWDKVMKEQRSEPEQQPKEHCDRECVCYEAATSGPAMAGEPKCPYDLGIKFTKGCKHDTRSRPAPASAPEYGCNLEVISPQKTCFGKYVWKESIASDDECFICPVYGYCIDVSSRAIKAASQARREERERVQPFVDLLKVISTKRNEMQDIMRRNKIAIDNVQEPMQKLAFTFYSEIAELAHKAEVVIEEYEESLRHPKNSSEFEGVGAKPNEGAP